MYMNLCSKTYRNILNLVVLVKFFNTLSKQADECLHRKYRGFLFYAIFAPELPTYLKSTYEY